MTRADEIISGMLVQQFPSKFWDRLDNTGNNVFKELYIARSCMQRNDRTVYQHTMQVLDCLENKNRITLWAALFHDIGKIRTRTINDDFEIHFHGHEKMSASIATKRLTEFGEDPGIVAKVATIIETHMLDLRRRITSRMARNFIATIGKSNVDNWFVVRSADALSYSKDDNYVDIIVGPFRTLIQGELDAMPKDTKMKHPTAKGDGLRIIGGNARER